MMHSYKSIYLIIFVLLFPFRLSASNYYVNKNASGQNNGTSWSNAWQSFSAINWGSINPGDFIYISGGTDSLVYNAPLSPNCGGNSVNWVTIIAGKYSPSPSGHSGRVIIDGNNHSQSAIFYGDGTGSDPSYIIIKGIETRNVYSGVYANLNNFHRGFKIDSCMIYGFYSAGIRLETGEVGYQNMDSVFIENCRIVSPGYIEGESDGIQVKGASRVFIHNNYIRIPNQQPTQHVDAIQGYLGNGFVITNNILINDSVYSPEGGGIPIIIGSEGTLPVIIYNNYCYTGGYWMPSSAWGGTLMTRWYGHNPMPPTWILNNTVVSNGPRTRGVWLEYATPTTTRVINNIIAQYAPSSSNTLDNFDNSTGSNLRVDSIRNNLYYRSWDSDVGVAGNLVGNGHTGTPSGWTDFVNNYGGTGVKGNPLLVSNIGHEPDQGLLNGELQSGSPAINQGEDIEWLLNHLNTIYGLKGRLVWEDINGNLRDDTPTIGAYEYAGGSDSTFSLSVNIINGWNLVSVPGINPNGMDIDMWWADRNNSSNVFKFDDNYSPITTTTPGEGYWMNHSAANIYNTGNEWPAGGIQIVPHNPINATTGWNLIGVYENSASTAGITTIPPGLIGGPIYKYSGRYLVATTINPGYGYWIKLTASGQIILPGTLSKENETTDWFPKDWGRIFLQDATGINYTLYAVNGEVELNQYELPPAPPEGMFDIRFNTGRIAEDLNSAIKTIEMSGVTYPLTVRVEGMDISLMDETGKTINVKLKSGEDVVINDATIQKLMVSGELIPTEYALEQNYPNPFNPSTVIEFSLPEVTDVSLTIYNTLGQKVTELVNGKLEAGRHSYQWNASNLATGMYIYELRTYNFVSVKKLLLMK